MKLYKKDKKGALRFWQCEINYISECLEIEFGIVGGETQWKNEEVECNSVREVEDQLDSRFQSRVNGKLKKGYVESKSAAMATTEQLNLLGYTKPALATKFNPKKPPDLENAIIQFKYNGHRCMITNDNGKYVAYSRNGIPIPAIDHIVDSIDIPNGMTIDGELYLHGMKLQGISSLVKKKQERTTEVKFICYDVVSDAPYPARYALLKTLSLGRASLVAPSYANIGLGGLDAMFSKVKASGYEGLMIKLDGMGYEPDARSKFVLKVKKNSDDEFIEDDEFEVVDIIPSKDGWARLVCKIGDKTFKVSCHGSMKYKHKVMRNKEKYIGRMVRCEYSEFTEDGLPFHPIAHDWRCKENE